MIIKLLKFLWSLKSQFMKYSVVGIGGVIIDISSLILLKEMVGLTPVSAVLISQVLSIIFVFLLNKYWSFGVHPRTQEQIIRFSALVLFNYCFSVAAMYLFNQVLNFDYRLVRIASIILMVSWNFIVYKYWVYRSGDGKNKKIKIRSFYSAMIALLKLKNWSSYLLDFFGALDQETIVYEMRNGLKFIARPKTADRGIMNTVVLQNEYKINNYNLTPESVVIDLGGQNGYFSVFASRRAGKIFVYEPIRDNYNIILKNIEINNLTHKIIAFNLAVSDEKRNLRIYLSKNTGGHSAHKETGDFLEVPTTTLPDIFASNQIEKCDLLKIDIEGGEYNVLYNLPDEYFKKIANICLEYHNIDAQKNNSGSLISFLKKKGFTVKHEEKMLFTKKRIIFAIKTK